jgi:hypothetical protein
MAKHAAARRAAPRSTEMTALMVWWRVMGKRNRRT